MCSEFSEDLIRAENKIFNLKSFVAHIVRILFECSLEFKVYEFDKFSDFKLIRFEYLFKEVIFSFCSSLS
jgi:hypothetical protein